MHAPPPATWIGTPQGLIKEFGKGKCLICKEAADDALCPKCLQTHFPEQGSAILLCICEKDKRLQPDEVRVVKKTPLEFSNINAVTFLGPTGDGENHIYVVSACSQCDPGGRVSKVVFADLIPMPISEGKTGSPK